MRLEQHIEQAICKMIEDLGRNDLFRTPLVAFSDADNPQYEQLKDIVGPWVRTPREFLEGANSVVSYFVPFTRQVAMAPPHDPDSTAIWGEAYAVINDYFAKVNEAICDYLCHEGYDASGVPATHTYDPATMQSAWSHRSAACIANLGYFSANRMLVTRKGSAGRYCTVFTSAKLEATTDAPVNRCPYLKNESCGRCFDACPVGALKPGSLDLHACQDVTQVNMKEHKKAGLYDADTCGKCIGVCPLAYFE